MDGRRRWQPGSAYETPEGCPIGVLLYLARMQKQAAPH